MKKKTSQNVRAHADTASFAVFRKVGVEKRKKKGGAGGKRKEKGGGGHLEKPRSRDKTRRKDASWKPLAAALEVNKNHPFDARGLSKRDAEFVTNILKGMGKDEAMRLASAAIGIQMSNSAAHVAAHKSMLKPEVDSAIVSALEDAGVNDVLVAEKIREGLDATAFTQTGIEHSDFRTRLGYIQTVLKVKGQIGADVENKNQILNYNTFKDE